MLVVPKWAEDAKLPKGIWRQVALIDEKQEDDGYQATVKIRGGAIVPLGKIIQNTSEKSLDPLTLLVCLDDSGKASGDLYEDAGEGFGYQKGEYALTHFVASREGGVTSRYVPVNAWPGPCAVEFTKQKAPPGRKSISQVASGRPDGSHQCFTCSGLVHASKTRCRGALKTRMSLISRSEGRAMVAL